MTTTKTAPKTYQELLATARSAEQRLVSVERPAADRATVRMDDPGTLNALSGILTIQLQDELTALAADHELRTIVLTGSDPAFSAGGDLNLMREYAHPMLESDQGATALWRWIRGQFGGVARLITRTDKTFVAAVNGAAAGVGLAFALACDIIVASENARIVPAFLRIGLIPEVGTSWLLTRRLGYQRTFQLFAEGRILSGPEALELGLVNEVVPHAELMARAAHWCDTMLELPAHTVPLMKPLLRNAADMSWDQAITMEEFAEPMCFTTSAHQEAVEALLEHADA
jgi:2-(1,2-epoxy-1,2-dihydrophenyl)acetyl-CoA isomerase